MINSRIRWYFFHHKKKSSNGRCINSQWHKTLVTSMYQSSDYILPWASIGIIAINRWISAIYIIISCCETTIDCYNIIGINPSKLLRIIVPAPQIVQPRLLIEHIPAIPKRLHLAQRLRQFASAPQRRAPRIVAVAGDGIAILIQNCNNIAGQG